MHGVVNKANVMTSKDPKGGACSHLMTNPPRWYFPAADVHHRDGFVVGGSAARLGGAAWDLLQLLLTEMSAQLLQMQKTARLLWVGWLCGEGAILRKKGRLLQVL